MGCPLIRRAAKFAADAYQGEQVQGDGLPSMPHAHPSMASIMADGSIQLCRLEGKMVVEALMVQLCVVGSGMACGMRHVSDATPGCHEL
ncbi:unnamed protein product [Vitrella brassicaformis CCMP3155]|uniref:Uncharacterized protein n=1 Tax=Vitrella brassicaformis (strain CCMP3155) TaxID=1169540 RepID=A0A0G4ELL7_VITBC|nr:unnamed protein product [Vitrella brassicaformis CCMP3155]|eukprot:CEL97909.1 unnamed protein product [Vitrella brassicaformis CCMP3155]